MHGGLFKKTVKLILFLISIGLPFAANAQGQLSIAKLKYNGGGDWYANKTALPNLIEFCNRELNMNLKTSEDIVEAGSTEIFQYPYVYATGHGNIVFSSQEAENIRKYLVSGGFLHIDDNYGLDQFIRLEMKKVFPNLEFV